MLGDGEMIMIKGKRSKRPRPSSPLALTMFAASSNSTSELGSGGGSVSVESSGYSDNSGELTPSSMDEEEYYMANCLILLSGGQSRESSHPRVTAHMAAMTATAELYQCKTCNKSFPSFQALGGHRSSHKKPNNRQMISLEERPPLSRNYKQESNLSFPLNLSNPAYQSKCRVHECSLCGAEFASGQALGGHMRRHRPIPPPQPVASCGRVGSDQEMKRPRNLLSLDLNLPAQQEDDRADQPKFRPSATKEEVIVFSTSSLIDCHY